jgi:hypothetical protein
MSRRNNVNPDHYKVAGRERPGNAVAPDPREPESGTEKTRAWKWQLQQKERQKRWGKRGDPSSSSKE